MKENFDRALAWIFHAEGYKSDNPADPGGLTIWGISKRAFPQEVTLMATMTPDQAKIEASTIYRKHYWDKINGDNLPAPIDIFAMDTAVNMGVKKALEILSSHGQSPERFALRRIRYYTDLKGFNTFGRGWVRRVLGLFTYWASDFTSFGD